MDETRIPTGDFLPVSGTPFDFTQPGRVGSRISGVPGPPPPGYDTNYVLWSRGEADALNHTTNCVAVPE